ncbi:hypothetical protein H4I95_07576 [Botrytis cinerea]
MACSIQDNKIVEESETILERKQPNGDEPAKPVAFGYFKSRRRQKLVSGVKIAFLQDSKSYGYAYAALVDAADDQLKSVQQIPEDFSRFAIEQRSRNAVDSSLQKAGYSQHLSIIRLRKCKTFEH